MANTPWLLLGLAVFGVLAVISSIYLGSAYMPAGPITRLSQTPAFILGMEGEPGENGDFLFLITGFRLTEYEVLNITLTPMELDQDGQVLAIHSNNSESIVHSNRYALQGTHPAGDMQVNASAVIGEVVYVFDARFQVSLNRTLHPDVAVRVTLPGMTPRDLVWQDLPYTHELVEYREEVDR